MTIEILSKPMLMFRTEHDLMPYEHCAPVWTPVYLEIVLASGIARWRVIGGFYDGYVIYVEKKDKDIFMAPDMQGKSGAYANV